MGFKNLFVRYVELCSCSGWSQNQLEQLEQILQESGVRYRYKYMEQIEVVDAEDEFLYFDQKHNKLFFSKTLATEELATAYRKWFCHNWKTILKDAEYQWIDGVRTLKTMPSNVLLVEKKHIKQANCILAKFMRECLGND